MFVNIFSLCSSTEPTSFSYVVPVVEVTILPVLVHPSHGVAFIVVSGHLLVVSILVVVDVGGHVFFYQWGLVYIISNITVKFIRFCFTFGSSLAMSG